MTECLPDFPRYVRQRGNEWQGADHPDGPWRPIPAPQSGLPWKADGPAVQSREPASVAAEATPADRMALALCPDRSSGTPCKTPCDGCRRDSATVAHEIVRQLRERYGSSATADWLDGVGCHPGTVLVAADDVPPVKQEITGNGSGASLPPFSNQQRVGEPEVVSLFWTAPIVNL